jgi:SAM-dependent methyltransferase
MAELARLLKSDDPLCVLDIGTTSASNIRFFTERGHRIYSADLLEASLDPALATRDEQGVRVLDSKKFLVENLAYPNAHFDLVFCWNLADYMDESLVKPVVGRLWSVMKPGGMLLAFFHTREAGPDAPCYRYHITASDMLEMHVLNDKRNHRREGAGTAPKTFTLQRVFNNRHIENLFRDFASIKFFLSRENVREVLVVR